MPAPASETPPPYYRKVRSDFRPSFTLGILYLFGFFFVYCLLLVSPSLFEVLRTVPIGPEQEEVAKRVAQEVVRPRLPIALLLSALSTVAGAHFGLLPGMKPRN